MRVHIGGDHAAYDLLADLVAFLQERATRSPTTARTRYDAEDDYPVFVLRAAEAVAADPGSLGVVLGGSGNGEQMAANKVAGIRAALCYDDELARLAREHNDAQVISIGARMTTVEEATAMVEAFLGTAVQRRAAARRAHRHGDRLRERRATCRRSRPEPRRPRAAPRDAVRVRSDLRSIWAGGSVSTSVRARQSTDLEG